MSLNIVFLEILIHCLFEHQITNLILKYEGHTAPRNTNYKPMIIPKHTNKLFFLNVCCVMVFYVFLCHSVCWFLYGPFKVPLNLTYLRCFFEHPINLY